MSNLVPGPALDARIAEWWGAPFRRPTHGSCCTCQICGHCNDECMCDWGEDEDRVGQVLDRLVEQGYEPALVYDKLTKQWTLCLHAQESSDICHGLKRDLGGDPARWQPTRPLAVAAAVVALMDEEHRQPCGE